MTTHMDIANAKHSGTATWAIVVTAQAQDDRHKLLGAAANFLDYDTLQRHTIPMPISRAAYAITTTGHDVFGFTPPSSQQRPPELRRSPQE